MPKVFISYSHDSDAHRQFVRDLCSRLRDGGLDCLIDQVVNGSPPDGWPCWMEEQIEQADFVLLVCTEPYLERFRRKGRQGGHGVTFEGVVITQALYNEYYRNDKFIPVIPESGSIDHVPSTLKQYTVYRLLDEYVKLYRVLTNQPEYTPPDVGEIRKLGEVPRVESDVVTKALDDASRSKYRAEAIKAIVSFLHANEKGKTSLLYLIANPGKGMNGLPENLSTFTVDDLADYILELELLPFLALFYHSLHALIKAGEKTIAFVLRELLYELVPCLFHTEVVESIAGKAEREICLIPVATSTVAEIVMAGFDQRPVEYVKQSATDTDMYGRYDVTRYIQPPNLGIADASKFVKAMTDHLVEEHSGIKALTKREGLTDDDYDDFVERAVGTLENSAFFHERHYYCFYRLAEGDSLNREVLDKFKSRFQPVVMLEVDKGLSSAKEHRAYFLLREIHAFNLKD